MAVSSSSPQHLIFIPALLEKGDGAAWCACQEGLGQYAQGSLGNVSRLWATALSGEIWVDFWAAVMEACATSPLLSRERGGVPKGLFFLPREALSSEAKTWH